MSGAPYECSKGGEERGGVYVERGCLSTNVEEDHQRQFRKKKVELKKTRK